MSQNILVIGNGFDIYHGLPTKYIDFVNNTEIKNQDNMFIKYFQKVAKENQTWIDCEQEIKRVVKTIFDVLEKIREDSANQSLSYLGTLSIDKVSDDQRNILKNIDLVFEEKTINYRVVKVRDEYIHPFYGINISQIMTTMKEELDSLIKVLEKYLMNNIDVSSIKIKSEQIKKIKPEYVVNFNYTDTYKLYDIKEQDVFYIHGRIGNTPNNMVFGFEDEDEFNLDDIYFKKYFQRIQKRNGLLDEKKFEPCIYADFGKEPVISHFFGLSMGVTDGDIIKKIEQLSNVCVIYYYNQVDYEMKVINLIKIFGKECFMQKIYDKEIQLEEIE